MRFFRWFCNSFDIVVMWFFMFAMFVVFCLTMYGCVKAVVS